MLKLSGSKKAAAKRQAGFVVTTELLLVTVILVIGLVTGWTKVRDQVLAELSDTGAAIGSINQSYTMEGTNWINASSNVPVAEVSGFAFADTKDNGSTGVGGDEFSVTYRGVPLPSSLVTSNETSNAQ